MTTFWLGQMTSQTFNIITVPINEPNTMPSERPFQMRNRSTRPVRNVIIAAQRNHHSAVGTSLVNASTFPASDALAK